MAMESNLNTSTQPLETKETHSLIGSDKVEGTAVYRSNGERVGKIQRVMIGKQSGKVGYAVMSLAAAARRRSAHGGRPRMRWQGVGHSAPGLTSGLATCCARPFDGGEPPATPAQGGEWGAKHGPAPSPPQPRDRGPGAATGAPGALCRRYAGRVPAQVDGRGAGLRARRRAVPRSRRGGPAVAGSYAGDWVTRSIRRRGGPAFR